ncbi:hypothetical protein Ddye_000362 [Dipteronia dyeriana]|uniref:TF-B3 domain-containing protein n=1 Tax=Dipteronia dyeriana TaxID=168575 RepID=A0AAD9XM33_9ROSI|nr:hypothetical protein Ddye_000362 [Dipteronia dyeriana]
MDSTRVWDFYCKGVSSDTPTVVDEEDITNSSALLLHVASSNASAVVDDEESTDFRAPLVSSNTPTMSNDKEISTSTPRGWFDFDKGTGRTDDDEVIVARTIQSFIHFPLEDLEPEIIFPTMSDDEEISTSSPRGWFEFDKGTGWTDDDEVIDARTIQSFNHFSSQDLEPKIFVPPMLRLRPLMPSAQSNLWQSTVLFSKLITKTDVEKKLNVPTQAMKHFSIPEGKEFADFLVKDLKGEIWNFRLTIHPMPALTDGWLEFVRAKDLVLNDIVTFYKLADEYRVEVDSEYKL